MKAKIRLYSGLILLFYVGTHLLNSALGLISLQAMESMLKIMQLLWNPGGYGIVVPVATSAHLSVVFWQIFKLPRLRMNAQEWTRLLLGLFIPFVLFVHFWGSHYAVVSLGFRPDYRGSIYAMFNPMIGFAMTLLVIVAWAHGCLGLHMWLRFRRWYALFFRWSLVPAIALPVLAIAGFVAGGKEVTERARDPEVRQEILRQKGVASDQELSQKALYEANVAGAAYAALLALVFGARSLNLRLQRRKQTIRILYPDGTEVLVHPGTTILNASRLIGFPHASTCGGRGRCSTCRIRIVDGLQNLPEPTPEESRVLARVGSAPNVRLACSSSPTGDIKVYPLLTIQSAAAGALEQEQYAQGHEMDLAILFADLRGFTRFSEHKLPYDVVFVLNQYFQMMGHAIEAENGHVDKFIGDGIMALFGLHDGLEKGCLQALRAAVRMEEQLKRLNQHLQHDLLEPLQMGMGIHCGHVIAGRMGYGRTVGLTAIGDPVNTASRLENMTRELNCRLILSEDVRAAAGLVLPQELCHEISVRGRQAGLQVYALKESDLTLLSR